MPTKKKTSTTEETPRKIVTGYKATDANIKCRDFQFTPGEWHEVEGELELCGNGFHFCEQPSGPWAYYSAQGTRIWKIEADDVLETEWEPGADRKCVARRIRLVEEIVPDGDGNTGDGNTGDGNTGYGNTGDGNTGDGNTGDGNTGYGNTGNGNTGYGNTGNGNTGDRNTGYRNTGDGNTGYRNTGDGNTGNGNTGDRNTGYRNTGDGNTGYRNTGDGNTGNGNTGYRNTGDRNTGDGNTGNGNTGYRNTGDRNTGYGNATDHCAGFFCVEKQTVPCFDGDTGLTFDEFQEKHGDTAYSLSLALLRPEAIRLETYASLPNITAEKLKALHEKHLAAKESK
jgi:hypothetical protein